MVIEYLKIAFKNLKSRSLRSWLTVLGIVIGVFLVTSLLSLSEGLKEAVVSELRMMGGDIIIIFPGEGSDAMTMAFREYRLELDGKDLDAIRRADGVDIVIEVPWTTAVVRHMYQSEPALIYGVSLDTALPILRENRGWEIARGSFPRSGRRELMVGSLVPRDVFPEMLSGDSLFIKGREFTVSGILRSHGNRQDDLAVTMDLSDFREVTGKREGTPVAIARVKDGYSVSTVVRNIERGLEESMIRRRHEDKPSFSVISSDTANDMVNGVMGSIQFAIVAFASIAIAVGGINIMNTMYTSVKERTKEIGLLKAVGARRRHIILIFLFEAGIIGFIGGIGGVLLGVMLALLVQSFISGSGTFLHFEAHISLWLVLFGLSFSFIVGCLSGLLPAKRAAMLEPAEALKS